MAEQTPNLGLTKPARSELYDVAVTNENMDKIDMELGGVTSQLAETANVLGISIEQYPRLVTETTDSPRLQRAIDNLPVTGGTILLEAKTYLFNTVVTLKSNVKIIGMGSGKTVIDLQNNHSVSAFTTPVPTKITLTQTNDIKAGDTQNTINNTLSAGDHIVFQSNDRFTEKWDGGVAIRDYYTKGEIFRVKSATATSVVFEEGAALDLPVSSSRGVEAFTPTRNISISGVSIKRNGDTASYSKGVDIKYSENVLIEDVKVYRNNDKGFNIQSSRDVTVNRCFAEGGYWETTGTNYGIAITDGSKFVNINVFSANNCRHGIAGGGEGYANPMYVTADNLFVTNSQAHSLDTHANCLGFTYRNAVVDNGFNASGRNIKIDTLHSTNGFFLVNGGGTDITLDKITFVLCTKLYSDQIAHNVRIMNSDIHMYHPTANGFKSGSTNISFENVRIINKAFEKVTTNTEADNTLVNSTQKSGVYLQDNFKLRNVYIEGFIYGFYADGKDCEVNDVTLKNCGWYSAIESSNGTPVRFSKNAQGGSYNNVKIGFNKTGLTNNTRLFRMDSLGTGTGANITISNFRHTNDHTMNYLGMYATNAFTELFLLNNRLNLSSGSHSISATGRFINNKDLADN